MLVCINSQKQICTWHSQLCICCCFCCYCFVLFLMGFFISFRGHTHCKIWHKYYISGVPYAFQSYPCVTGRKMSKHKILWLWWLPRRSKLFANSCGNALFSSTHWKCKSSQWALFSGDLPYIQKCSLKKCVQCWTFFSISVGSLLDRECNYKQATPSF